MSIVGKIFSGDLFRFSIQLFIAAFKKAVEFWQEVESVAGHGGPEMETLFIFFIFIIWGGTRSLRMPTLRPASQAGPMHNPREGTSVVLRDTIRLT